MKCPICKGREQVSIDLHADGFSPAIRECGACGTVWTFSKNKLKIIQTSGLKKVTAYSDFVCPTCKSVLCVETDLDAFQFHEELQECANCGTVCSSAHAQVEVIKDSQSGSFLSTTAEVVEADDYVFT
jgi:uncharacterized Zn finger protein